MGKKGFKFNVTEGIWFIEWVVMRRKYLKSQEEIEKLKKDKQGLRNDINDLKLRIEELEKSKRQLRSTMSGELAKERQKYIEEFNKKNNKGRRYKRRR